MSAVIPRARPGDDTMIVEKMKALSKQGGVWDELSDGFQRRAGNRSRVGLALCDYGIRPGHSCSPEPFSSLPLLFETWEGEMPKCSWWGRHRHMYREPRTHEPAGLSLPVPHNPVLGRFLHSCPSLAPPIPCYPGLLWGQPKWSGSDPKLLFGYTTMGPGGRPP